MTGSTDDNQWPRTAKVSLFLDVRRVRRPSRTGRDNRLVPKSPNIQSRRTSIRYLPTTSTPFHKPPFKTFPGSTRSQDAPPSEILPTPKLSIETTQQPAHLDPREFLPLSQQDIAPNERYSTQTPNNQLQANLRKELGSLEDSSSKKINPFIYISQVDPPVQENGRLPHNEISVDPPHSAKRNEKTLWSYRNSRFVAKGWLPEILSWVTSAVCMGMIIGVLIFLKNKQLPTWPLGITLNAFIAVISKIATATLILPVTEALGQLKWYWFQGDRSRKIWDFEIFDKASRGPWGAFQLLGRTKGNDLAAIGAIVIIISIALDPFFQQVVTFPDRWTLQGNSSLPRLVYYDPKSSHVIIGNQEQATSAMNLNYIADMFFFDNGTQPVVIGNGTRPEIPLSCPTSNCTWPQYETLAICSECTDVSSLLAYDCTSGIVEWSSHMTGAYENRTYPHETVCGHFLTINSTTKYLMSGYVADPTGNPKGEVLVARTLPLVTSSNREILLDGSIHFKRIRNPIFDAIISSAANGPNSVYRNETPIAHECMMSWCVKTMKSSYISANYEEEIIQVYRNETPGPNPWEATPTLSDGINDTDYTYFENVTIQVPSSDNTTSHFGLSNGTHLDTIFIFDQVFPSFQTAANSTAPILMRWATYDMVYIHKYNLDFNPWILPHNITEHLNRLGTAMINVLRSGTSAETVSGNAYALENYISVRWEWLALPLGLLLLTFIFLALTISRTAKEQRKLCESQYKHGHIGVWKTSAMAMVLYGLPHELQQEMTLAAPAGTPRPKPRELKVKLLPERGWQVSDSPVSATTAKSKGSQISLV